MKSLFYTVILLTAAAMHLYGALSFVADPSLTQENGKWYAGFEVNEDTDVEVSIVRLSDSSVVRHLAAGVLGPNAPAPLASNSLSQKIEWGGMDDLGNTVSNPESLSVRVRAGMSVSLNNLVGGSPYKFNKKVMGLALDSDGSVYIFGISGTLPQTTIRKYDGSGHYLKTIFPYPSTMAASEVSGYGINLWTNGKYNPKTTFIAFADISETFISDAYYHATSMFPQVIGDELWIFSYDNLKFIKIKKDGQIASGAAEVPIVASPVLPGKYDLGGPVFTCLSPDQKFIYLSGIYEFTADTAGYNNPVDTGFWQDGQVFKVDLQTGNATSWLKLPNVPLTYPERVNTIGPRYLPSKGSTKLNAALHGIAVDDSGRVFVCDRLNQRVAVYDADANLLGSVPVVNPDLVEVNKKTGELYVVSRAMTGYHTGAVSIRKFSGWGPGRNRDRRTPELYHPSRGLVWC